MSKKKSHRPKNFKPGFAKRHGHYCYACGRRRADEKFSRKGHATHLCKDCASEKRAEQKEKRIRQSFGPAYLANQKQIFVSLNYANWRFYPWKEEFDASIFVEQFADYR